MKMSAADWNNAAKVATGNVYTQSALEKKHYLMIFHMSLSENPAQ